jgi:1-acyl-sn-glycerol-3-phosphate acyltransferase
MYNLVAVPAMFLIGKIAYGIRVKGRRNLRGYSSGLVAANHCQFVEPGFSGMILWPRKVLFSAEENNVTRRDVGWLTRLLRAFGIPDDAPMSIAGFVKKGLENGWLIHFYPEGVLSWRSQDPGPFLEGVFFFSFLNNVPVFPLTEVLRDRPIRRVFPWWPPKTIFVIGEPVLPADFRKPGVARRDLVHAMSEHVHRIMVETIADEGGCRSLPEKRQAAV